MSEAIKSLSISGFKSIRSLQDFELRPLNVLIGANGAGKSNFVSFFRLLRDLLDQRLEFAIRTREGGADSCLYLGPRITKTFSAKVVLSTMRYEFEMQPSVNNQFVFAKELFFDGLEFDLGSGHTESALRTFANGLYPPSLWRLIAYHFHDTSLSAGVRRQSPINNNETLLPDAGNLAAFLYRLKSTHPHSYNRIRGVVRLAAPFFDDFKLRPIPTSPDLIQMEWQQKDSDYPFLAHQLSDGTLRFICIATALLQPTPPATMLFDEPELGLHPYALALLGSLLNGAKEANPPRQIIISTQSVPLLNEFSPDDVIVVDRHHGESIFHRLIPSDLSEWLNEYSLGELWQKNLLGGRPHPEESPQLVGPKDPA